MKRFLVIPDLHGRDIWKNFGDIDTLLSQDVVQGYDVYKIETEFDKYIFLGDYCDSFTIENVLIKNNLLDVIKFKELYPDKVILLWGNHEMHYLYNDYKCSGFRAEAWWDLNIILNKYKELFQLSYQYDNHLFTHAGVHKGWYKFRFKTFDTENTLSDSLNLAFEMRIKELFDVGYQRYGRHDVGGPLWLDKSLGSKKPLEGFHQYVGHSYRNEMIKFKIDDNTSISFCDNQGEDIDMGNLDKYYLILNIDDKED